MPAFHANQRVGEAIAQHLIVGHMHVDGVIACTYFHVEPLKKRCFGLNEGRMCVACEPRHPITSVDKRLGCFVKQVIVAIKNVGERLLGEHQMRVELCTKPQLAVFDGRLSTGFFPARLGGIGASEIEDGVETRPKNGCF